MLTDLVYFDEDRAAEAANDPDERREGEHGEGERLPIVGPIVALFGVIGAWLGLRSRR